MKRAKSEIAVRYGLPSQIEDNAILNIFANSVTSYTHGFHKYPAKFIPQIPKWAIEKYLSGKQGCFVLDPFCGSGTTLVETLLAGHNAIGIDVDALSCFISKVKTTPVNLVKLDEVTGWVQKEIKRRKSGRFKPECETIQHWFTNDAIKKLSLIRTVIDEVSVKFGETRSIKDIQDLLILCFSSIIRRASNADNESQKTYVSHTHVKKPEEVFGLFFLQLSLFEERIRLYSNSIVRNLECEVIYSSSTRSFRKILAEKNPDLVITSPPYIKAIDYIYNQMAELFWIGDLFGLQTQTRQNAMKAEYVGTKHIPKQLFADYSPYSRKFDIAKLDKKLQQVFFRDNKNGHKHSYVTYRYFTEMEKHFAEMARCLHSGVHYVMVVGNSTVSSIHFETADYLTDISERNGFRLTNRWGYKIKNRYMRFDRKGRGGTIEVDWVLDLERS